MEETAQYGNNVYNLLGGKEGIKALVKCFYRIMGEVPEAQKILKMHPKNLGPTRENLALFLSGWLGGPPRYIEKHGSVNLTDIHGGLDIDVAERDMWLSCMEQALNEQAIEDNLKAYLLKRFQIPAEKIRATCMEQNQGLTIIAINNSIK